MSFRPRPIVVGDQYHCAIKYFWWFFKAHVENPGKNPRLIFCQQFRRTFYIKVQNLTNSNYYLPSYLFPSSKIMLFMNISYNNH